MFIILFSILVPPMAVFIRFGIGKDFFINVLCTIAGYIPGHVCASGSVCTDYQLHNFFLQARGVARVVLTILEDPE